MSFPRLAGVSWVEGDDTTVTLTFDRKLTSEEKYLLMEEIRLMEHQTIVDPFETAH